MNSFWKKVGPRVQNYKRTELDGYSFQSKLEAALYQELKLLEGAGQVKLLQCQDHIHLSKAKITYIADFKIFDQKLGQEVWCEAKGFENDRWPVIKKLWAYYGPGLLRIYKGSYRKLRLVEEIPSRFTEEP